MRLSVMPREKKTATNSPQIFYFFFNKKNAIWKKTSSAFSVFSKKYLPNSLKRIGGKTNWFLDCIVSTKIYQVKVQAIKPDAVGLGTKS